VNTLARSDTSAPERLAALAAELRAATASRDGRRLRELSGERGPLIDDLVRRALAAAGIDDPPASLRTEVAETLTSALADPDTAQRFAAGTLIRAAQWAGFEGAPADDFPASFATTAPEPAPRLVPLRPATQEPSEGLEPSEGRGAAPPPRAKSQAPAKTGASSRAEVPDELAARRRKNHEDAERSVAAAADAASAAVAREDELEAEVRDLEDRLTRARSELADARRHARRTESAERKARQALDRLRHS
jgi:hypothetical protein